MPEYEKCIRKSTIFLGNYQTPKNHSPFAVRKFGGFSKLTKGILRYLWVCNDTFHSVCFIT